MKRKEQKAAEVKTPAKVRPNDTKEAKKPEPETKNPLAGEDFTPTKVYEPIESIRNDDLTPHDMLIVVDAGIEDAGLVGHNIRSFDKLLTDGLRQIVTQLFKIDRIIKNDRAQTARDQQHESTLLNVTFSDLETGKPMCNSYPIGNPMAMFPNKARESGLAYSGSVTLSAHVELTAKYKDGSEVKKVVDIDPFPSTRFPIMYKSIGCHARNLTREQLKNVQEDPNDPGGYFITKGQEWTVDLLENIRFNTLHVHDAMVANERVRGEFISQPGSPFENSSQVVIRYMTNGSITIEINSTKLSKARIPFYLIYRLFGTTSDKNIISMIVPDVDEGKPESVESKMLSIIEGAVHISDAQFVELKDVLDQPTVVQRLAEKLSKYLTNQSAYLTNESAIQYLNSDLLNIFDRNLYPHMGTTQESRQRKLRLLGMHINEILLVFMGIIPPTDRDALPNKRVHGAGVSLAKAFKTQFNTSMLIPVFRAFKRELKNNSFDSITTENMKVTFRNALLTPDFDRAMTHALTSGNKPILIKRRAVTNRVSAGALERKNALNVISSLRTITTHSASNASKQTDRADMMRRVHSTMPGYICVSQSADTGENVGMRKQLALTASVCDAEDAVILEMSLLADEKFIVPFDEVSNRDIALHQLTRVYVNGKLIGVCRQGTRGVDLVQRYRMLRREGRIITRKTTIEWSVTTNKVNFLLDVGRLVRPLLIVDSNIEKYDAACREAFKTKDPSKKIKFVQNIRLTKAHTNGILAGRIKLSDLVEAGIVEYITPEEEENCLVASSFDVLRRNQNNVAMQYTHCDVPQAILGFAAHLSPFANHTQPARVTYETNQGRQTGGWYAMSFPFRADKNRFWQFYNEMPLVRTITSKYIPSNGVNVSMAYMSFGGDNMEDSVIMNKAAVDRGLFEGSFFRFEKAELEKGEKFCTPDPLTTDRLKNGATYEYLEDGFVKVGITVHKGYVLIGRVKELRGRVGVGADVKYQFADRSIVYTNDEPAVVVAVLKPRGANDEKFGLVKLRHHRPLRKGDKTSTRSGNKSIVALLAQQSDMPFDDEGNSPDMILNTHCLTGDTPVTLANGVSKRIDSFPKEGKTLLWAWDEKIEGFTPSVQTARLNQGVKPVVKLTLEDGRTIRCTEDHKIKVLTPEGKYEWVEAKDLSPSGEWDGKKWIPSETPMSRIVIGPEAPLDDPSDYDKRNEKKWKRTFGEFKFSMKTEENREKTLAFMRLLGLVCSDGTISTTKTGSNVSRAYLGHPMDVQAALNDVKLLTNKSPTVGHDDEAYSFSFPMELTKAFTSIPEMVVGRKVNSASEWPAFLHEDNCPASIIREFLGGLFGGDGHAPCLVKSTAKNRKAKGGKDRLNMHGIAFSQSIVVSQQDEMVVKMKSLINLLSLVGVENARLYGPVQRKQHNSKDLERRVQVGVDLPETTEFAEKVGFRYCIQKMCRLTGANAYWRFVENVKYQHNRVIKWTSEGFDNKEHKTLTDSLASAKERLLSSEPALNEYYSLPPLDVINRRRASTGRLTTLNRLDYSFIDDASEFLQKTGCLGWFYNGNTQKRFYVTTKDEKHLPCFTLGLLDRRPDGEQPVYDISVDKNHSFCSNGVLTHNCCPSRMIIGQMLETQLATICAKKGVIADGSAFLPVDAADLCDEMAKVGYRYNGRKRLFNGTTGNYFDAAIYMGTTYEQRLQKFVYDDEYTVGGIGPTDATTGQPLAGKNVHGGLRIGEMEGWNLAGNGTCLSWYEKFSEDSDGRPDFRCRLCGNRAIFNERHEIYQCNVCKEQADISKTDSSKSAIVLQEELGASNIRLQAALRPREFERYEGEIKETVISHEVTTTTNEKEEEKATKKKPSSLNGRNVVAEETTTHGAAEIDNYDDLLDELF